MLAVGGTGRAAIVAFLLIVGGGCSSSGVPDSLGWGDREGDAWTEFSAGYSDGWDDGCEEAFDLAPRGKLYSKSDYYAEDGWSRDEYDSSDCSNGDAYDASDIPDEAPSDPYAAGEEIGQLDGCEHVFEDVSSTGTLYYGDRQVDETICDSGSPILGGPDVVRAPSVPASPSNPVADAKVDVPAAAPTDEPPHSNAEAPAPKQATDLVIDCSDFDMHGVEGGSGAGYFQISAKNMSCSTAKAYILEIGQANGFLSVESAGFVCEQLSSKGETYQYRCATPDEKRAFRYWFGA